MGKEQETNRVYEIEGQFGQVQIADEVVAIIAALAATEVDGVEKMSGNITNGIINKLGMKSLSKGVKVQVIEGEVLVDLALELKYGVSLPKVCRTVQDRVKSAIETMTGLTVREVNVKIAGIAMQKEEE